MSATPTHYPVAAEPSCPPAANLPEQTKQLQHLRVALVHDWLTTYAGSERVVEQILCLFPDADLFTLVDHLPPSERGFLHGKVPQTSFLQRLPASRRLFRKLLWLHPSAIENFDLSGYDLIISSSHAVAKGVLTGPGQLHICYCHSPMRYAWDMQHEYLHSAGLDHGIGSIYARLVLHYLRLWDLRTVHGVDFFVANSNFIAQRIQKVYGRAATVVHPPVDVDSFTPGTEQRENFYLAASRLVPYKRMQTIVKGFSLLPDKHLVVVGDGPGSAECRALASKNTTFLGHQPAPKLLSLMRKAKAFVFAAEEDFGITVVEAQACGTPVICYGRGGVLDSVIANRSGVFFDKQTPESLAAAVSRFEADAELLWDSARIRHHALTFRASGFRQKFAEFIASKYKASSFAATV